jgi:hypothetical protein
MQNNQKIKVSNDELLSNNQYNVVMRVGTLLINIMFLILSRKNANKKHCGIFHSMSDSHFYEIAFNIRCGIRFSSRLFGANFRPKLMSNSGSVGSLAHFSRLS